MLKAAVVGTVVLGVGGYYAGLFGPAAYSRTVARPPAEVRAALEQLDFAALPGAPGSTAAAAGGIKPVFRLAEEGDRVTWYVMSGDKVATAMTAALAPADGGKATRITTAVKRGDAPDDFVSPAFRSAGLTAGLFGMAIEAKMNALVAPKPDAATCRELFERMAGPGPGPGHRTWGLGDGVNQIVRLQASEGELRRHGCDTNNDGTFRTPEQRLADGDPNALAAAGIDPNDAAPAGKPPRPDAPMSDARPSR